MQREREQSQCQRQAADAITYRAATEHIGYVDEPAVLGFTNTEWSRQLAPILKRMTQEETG